MALLLGQEVFKRIRLYTLEMISLVKIIRRIRTWDKIKNLHILSPYTERLLLEYTYKKETVST